MKTWEQLNAEFTQERMKINPDVKKLEEIYLQMLNMCHEVESNNLPSEKDIMLGKIILLACALAIIGLAIFI